ncbi:MAG: HAMP domain-containing sensor histidine kinase [Pseudomonadota bacterium]
MKIQDTPRRGLQSILTTQLLSIAALVILVNVGFVAIFDASDRDTLVNDLLRREVLRLEAAYLDVDQRPDILVGTINGIYDDYPSAYAFAIVGEEGTVLEGKNVDLIPAKVLRPGELATDWLAWPNGLDATPVVASHSIPGSDPAVSVLFVMHSDPAHLVRAEIWDEFLAHVWLPLIPIAVSLIGVTLLIIGRALRPVAAAATWARGIEPGRGIAPLDVSNAPAEILDLTEAVQRSIERLDAELVAEQRRAAEAAHALRTPVAVLVARLDELPNSKEYESLREDVNTLSRMVTQYLSSSGADRLQILDEARADLSEIAESVVADLFPAAERVGCEIVLTGNDAPHIVHGAEDAITLALTNLVENALHHAGQGAIDVTVGPGTTLSVRDRGPGLPDKEAGNVFEPFHRGAGAPRGGAGLGLAIVERIQRAHGGTVTAETPTGGGTVFRLGYRPA